jgi:hypothetical protein
MAVKSESNFLIICNWDSTQYAFTEMTGGESSRESEQYPLALIDGMDSVLGRDQVSNIVLRAPYDPEEHNEIYRKYKTYCQEAIEVTAQPITVCPETEPDGDPEVFLGCKPVRCKLPDKNRGSTTPAVFEVELSVRESKLG